MHDFVRLWYLTTMFFVLLLPREAVGIYYGEPATGKLSTYIPRIQTPGCSYGAAPSVYNTSAHPDLVPLLLQDCTQPIAPSAVDLRGLWQSADGHVERIEQCGLRIVITSSGVIHDNLIANGRELNGVDDVGDACSPIVVGGLFHTENQSFIFYPSGAGAVSRTLIGTDTLQWIHPNVGTTDYTRATGTSTTADGIYYGNPNGPTLSTFSARIQTPGCSYGADPSVSNMSAHPDLVPLLLQNCTQPIPSSAVDLRGLWESPDGHIERIEQCGLRIIVTSSGVIHDTYIANGREEDGVDDVQGGTCDPIIVAGLFHSENQSFVFYQNGAAVVSRQLIGADTLRWIHPTAGTVDYARATGTSTAADGIYYGNPDGPTLSTFYHRYGTPGCNTGTTPSVPSEDLASSPTPDEAPLMLDGCTQPIAPSAVDMRGLWYSETQGYMRIEQCGLRIIITTSTIHDCYIANGRLADGVFDMNSANCSAINNNCRFFNDTQTVTFYASDADATNNVNPEVSRQLLDENTIQVIHSQFGTSNYSRV